VTANNQYSKHPIETYTISLNPTSVFSAKKENSPTDKMADNSELHSRRRGTSSYDNTEEELLDIDEQEEMIQQLHKRSQTINELYRNCFLAAGVLLTIIYLYFSYVHEEFGESVGASRASLIHFLTALGSLIMCYRAKTAHRNTYWIITDERNRFMTPEKRGKNTTVAETSATSPSMVRTRKLDQVINNPKNIEDWKQSQPWWTDNLGFVFTVVICIIQFVLWFGPLRANVRLGLSEAIKKPAILVFPFILPLYTAATEYATILTQRTENDIFTLHRHKYLFKKL
jgi:hypothetical protein